MNDHNLLVKQALAGCQASYTQLYKLLIPLCRKNSCKMLRTSEDHLAEFAHDTATRILLRLHTFAGDAQLSTWATRIIRNEAITYLRLKKRKMGSFEMIRLDAPNEEGERWIEIPSSQDIERQVIASQRAKQVLDQMRPRDREMAKLAWIDDMLGKDIAKMQGRTLAAVKTHQFHIRRHIRAQVALNLSSKENHEATHP